MIKRLKSLLLLFLFFNAFSFQALSDTATPNGLKNLAFQMAGEIMALRGNQKIALRPFIKGQTSLDMVAASRLYDQLYGAFSQMTVMGGFQLVDQRHIMELLSSREEFYMDNPEDLLQRAQADIEIICHPQALIEKLRLSCIASDLHSGITYSTRETVIAFDAKIAGAIDYQGAIEILAQSFVGEMRDMASIASPVLIDLQSGSETATTALLGQELVSNLRAHLLKKQRLAQSTYEANQVLNSDAEAPKIPDGQYSFEGRSFVAERKQAAFQLSLLQMGVSLRQGRATPPHLHLL